MAGPIAVDTPDYQRGVVNAQKLLKYVYPPAASATVGVPPNAETLIIVYPVALPYQGVSVLGASTGIPYPTVINSETNNTLPGNTAWCDVSAAVDSEVTITINGWTGDGWWVYADSGVHVMVDAANTRDGWGRLQVVSTSPGNQPWTHPLVELSYASATVGNGGVVLAAPGAGNRYRIFAAQIGNFTTSVDASLYDSNGAIFCTAHSVNPSGWFTYPLTGIALPNNSNVRLGAGGGTCTAVVVYTTEVV